MCEIYTWMFELCTIVVGRQWFQLDKPNTAPGAVDCLAKV